MPASGTLFQPATPVVQPNVSAKPQYRPTAANVSTYTRPVVSPPSASSSVKTSAVPSLTSGSYTRSSSSDQESSVHGGHSVDLIDMMTDRLGSAIDPLPLDRSLARQAQSSGELNAKQRELAELQALAQRRLRGTRANLANGMKAAKEVRKDLEWTQNRVR
ncbi:MAG: hypothetical protein MMC23_009811 [Stictis urceolatum]|nr:hypothetical protein [Stictis urceolata]